MGKPARRNRRRIHQLIFVDAVDVVHAEANLEVSDIANLSSLAEWQYRWTW
jgi:hypothetical protein